MGLRRWRPWRAGPMAASIALWTAAGCGTARWPASGGVSDGALPGSPLRTSTCSACRVLRPAPKPAACPQVSISPRPHSPPALSPFLQSWTPQRPPPRTPPLASSSTAGPTSACITSAATGWKRCRAGWRRWGGTTSRARRSPPRMALWLWVAGTTVWAAHPGGGGPFLYFSGLDGALVNCNASYQASWDAA